MTHRGPFQPLPFCDYVIYSEIKSTFIICTYLYVVLNLYYSFLFMKNVRSFQKPIIIQITFPISISVQSLFISPCCICLYFSHPYNMICIRNVLKLANRKHAGFSHTTYHCSWFQRPLETGFCMSH